MGFFFVFEKGRTFTYSSIYCTHFRCFGSLNKYLRFYHLSWIQLLLFLIGCRHVSPALIFKQCIKTADNDSRDKTEHSISSKWFWWIVWQLHYRLMFHKLIYMRLPRCISYRFDIFGTWPNLLLSNLIIVKCCVRFTAR